MLGWGATDTWDTTSRRDQNSLVFHLKVGLAFVFSLWNKLNYKAGRCKVLLSPTVPKLLLAESEKASRSKGCLVSKPQCSSGDRYLVAFKGQKNRDSPILSSIYFRDFSDYVLTLMWLVCHLSLQLWHIRYAYPPAEDILKSPGENKCQWLIELFKLLHFELIVGVGTERAAQLWNL